MIRGVRLGIVIAALVALGLRCPELDRRPMHTDEAVNALKFGVLWQEGTYAYDPNEHHGPALAYLTLAWSKLTRAPDFIQFTEKRLRSLTVLFGAGLILLLPLVADGIGRKATLWAALLTAVSPAMVFYSRDYIHETLLVFFTFLALAAGWRYSRSGRTGWILLAGAAVGLMQSAKETFVLALAAIAVALALNGAWMRWVEAAAPSPAVRPRIKPRHVLVAIGVWVAVAAMLFSSFFTNAAGLLDAMRTYLFWLGRAEESVHAHPWDFYLTRLAYFHPAPGPVWSEGLILGLALVGIFVALARKGLRDTEPGFLRFMALYTIVLAAIYCSIPYKTPWCLLSFWQGAILMAGVGAATLLKRISRQRLRFAATVLLLAATGQLAFQAWRAGITYAADRRNPYVYAQTSPDLLELVSQLNAVAQTRPEGRHLLVKVMAPGADYWPLPWYLRVYDHVGWWSELPADPLAPVMIVSTALKADLEAQGAYVLAGLFQLRPGAFLEFYVESGLWHDYVRAQAERGSH